jgi:hypothetical protein
MAPFQVVQQEALTRLLVEKGIFTKKEFLEMVRVADREMKRERESGGQPRSSNLSRTSKLSRCEGVSFRQIKKFCQNEKSVICVFRGSSQNFSRC